jgi:hypothetical protein
MKLEFSLQIFEKKKLKSQVLRKFVKRELFHTDRRIDRNDEANSRFSQFCKRA